MVKKFEDVIFKHGMPTKTGLHKHRAGKKKPSSLGWHIIMQMTNMDNNEKHDSNFQLLNETKRHGVKIKRT